MFLLDRVLVSLATFYVSAAQLSGCEPLLKGQVFGVQVGAKFEVTSFHGRKRIVESDRSGLERLSIRSKAGELNIYLDSAKVVKALSLIASPSRPISLCSILKLGSSSFEQIDRQMGPDALIAAPTWSEGELVHYSESYRRGSLTIKFVNWTDCGNKGLACEAKASSRLT